MAAAVGVLIGLALLVPHRGGSASSRLRLFGEELPDGADGVDVGVALAERSLVGWFNLNLPDESKRRVAFSDLGVVLDRARFQQTMRDTASSARLMSEQGSGASAEGVDLVVPIVLDRERALATLLALKEELDQRPADARLALDSGAVIAERSGRNLDVDCSLDAIETALQRGAAASLCFRNEPARRRASEIAGVRQDILLGFYETRIDGDRSNLGDRSPSGVSSKLRSSSREPASKLGQAAGRVDGYVVLPGTVFDFNAALGRLDEGDRVAVAMMAEGELVDGADVTASALAATLHAAGLFAGLDVVERHRPRRPSLIDVGLDVAVAYPITNLRLKNPYDFPVVLRARLEASRLRAEIRGPERPYTISIVRKIDRAIPFVEIESPDSMLERGVRIVAQRGVAGIELHRYRIRRHGAHAVREVSRDHYPPTPQLVRVGVSQPLSKDAGATVLDARDAITAGRPQVAPSLRDWFADELLVASQTADIDAPLIEQRVAGRFTAP